MKVAQQSLLREELRAFMVDNLGEKDAQNLAMNIPKPPVFEYKEGSNEVFFNGGVTGALLDSCDAMLKAMKDEKEIVININSVGGSAYTGIAVANMLAAAEQKITMNVLGMAYSAASLILQGADERYVAPAAIIGVHKAKNFAFGNTGDMAWMQDYLTKLDEGAMELYATRVPEAKLGKLKEYIEKDTPIHGKEAVELGLADGVMDREAAKAVKARYSAVKDKNAEAIDAVDEEVKKKSATAELDYKKKKEPKPDEGKPTRRFDPVSIHRFHEDYFSRC